MKKIFYFLFCAVSIFAACFSGEMYLRAFRKDLIHTRPAQLQNESLEYAPSVFARHVLTPKEKHFISRVWRTKRYGFPDYKINDKGYRGNSFSMKKKDGDIRIIVYGGSAVFDLAMPEGKDWPHQVEAFLKQDGIPNVEVINAGIPGHASYDSLGRLFAEGHLFNPDYVLIYNTWNDIKRFASDQSLLREQLPYTPASDPFSYYQNKFDQYFGERFFLYTFLRNCYFNHKYKRGIEGITAVPADQNYKMSPYALKQFQLDMELFVDTARNIGAIPILMTQGRLVEPGRDQKERWRLRHVRQSVPYNFACEAFVKADEIIRSVAKDKKALLIDAAEILNEKDKILFIDHVHLSEDGAEVLAAEVAKELRKIILHESPLAVLNPSDP